MEKIKITAEWARNECSNILTDKIQKEIDVIEKAIIEATKVNENKIILYVSIDKVTIKEFQDRGFKIHQYHGSLRDGSYVTLLW